mmetsp:Transcript_19089/g.24647  ORF Transcript_19089/g.24647 Transcript_19089/m.24647 type:complete len:395 (-) Transcript_19089:255-1439(-)
MADEDGVKNKNNIPTSNENEEEKKDSISEKENPFSQYYSQLLHQQNMLQDHVRTSTYQNAILNNRSNFEGKVVLDVGTGSGILAFFAIQAGAKKVYAVEASEMAHCAQMLVDSNNLHDRIEILHGKVEEVEVKEKVDVIISEPIGFLLVHERMLESYVAGRERFLKPGGLMLPTNGTIVFAPLSDQVVYDEQVAKASFWQTQQFYGVDLSVLKDQARQEHLSQPIVGYISSDCLLTQETVRHTVDFQTCSAEDLKEFTIPFSFTINRTALCHGFGCWFDADFNGTTSQVTLSTAPSCPGTHWYQCRLLLKDPLAVNATQRISGELSFKVNEKFSYFITVRVCLDGTQIESRNKINLQDQVYHYLTSPQAAAPAQQQGASTYQQTSYGDQQYQQY